MRKRNQLILSILLLLCIAILPSLIFFVGNVEEMAFIETLPVIGIFFIIALGALALFALVTRRIPASALCAAAAVFWFTYFAASLERVRRLIDLSPRFLVPLMALLFLGACLLFAWKVKREAAEILLKIAAFSALGLVLFNGALALPTLLQGTTEEPAPVQVSAVETAETLPNIYLMIFDEYAGFDVMEKYYGYDNGEFKRFLQETGFTVSTNSFSHSTNTLQVLVDLFNLNYEAPEDMTRPQMQRRARNGSLFTLLASLGYDLYEAETRDTLDLPSLLDITDVNTKSETSAGETFSQIMLNRTALYPFTDRISQYIDAPRLEVDGDVMLPQEKNMTLLLMDYLENPDNFPMENAFVFVYALCPHTPFQFDRDGNLVEWKNRANWADPQYYLDQYIYITKRIRSAVENIVARDPNAIIILQSDHGARLIVEDMPLRDKLNTLNAVYWQGKPFPQMAGHTHVDTERMLLSEAFGLDLPPLREASTESVSLEVTGIKYKSQSTTRYSEYLYAGDVVWEQTGNSLRWTNTAKYSTPARYGWKLYSDAFQLIREVPLSDDPSWSCTIDEPGQYWMVACVQAEGKSRLEKICASVTRTEADTVAASVDKTHDILTQSTYTYEQDENRFVLRADVPTDDPNVSFMWIVYDSSYSAIRTTEYTKDTTFSCSPEPGGQKIIALRILYEHAGYSEVEEGNVATLAWDKEAEQYTLRLQQPQ